MKMEKALEILRRENKLIIIHESADPDALGSAIAVSRIFGGDIDISGGINRIARKMLDLFQINSVQGPDFSEYGTIIVLDTASPTQLHRVPDRVSLVIDHHMNSGEWNFAEHRVIDEEAWSCTQIIKRILEQADIDMDERTCLALLMGMYSDTKGLSMGDHALLKDVADCMERSMVDVQFLKEILKDESQNVRISILKGFQRLRYRNFGNVLVVWTRVSTYEGAVANKLIDSGADIALVGSERDGFVRVTGRASDSVVKRGFHLGRFFSSLGYIMEGEGGGHDGAAGFRAVGDVEYILKTAVARIEGEIRRMKED